MSDILNSMVQSASGTDNTVLSEKNATKSIVIGGLVITGIAMGFSFLGKNPKELCLGFLFGGVIAQLVFYLHGKNVDRSLKDPDKMALIQKGGYYMRLLIRGGALAAAYFSPKISILSTFAGLMTVPAAIYILTFVAVIQSSRQEKRAKEKAENETKSDEQKEE